MTTNTSKLPKQKKPKARGVIPLPRKKTFHSNKDQRHMVKR